MRHSQEQLHLPGGIGAGRRGWQHPREGASRFQQEQPPHQHPAVQPDKEAQEAQQPKAQGITEILIIENSGILGKETRVERSRPTLEKQRIKNSGTLDLFSSLSGWWRQTEDGRCCPGHKKHVFCLL